MSTDTAAPEVEPTPTRKPRKWIKRTLIAIAAVIVFLLALIITVLLYFRIPSNSAGLAAQTVCSGTFVSGRNADDVFTQDVLPQSPALSIVKTSADPATRSVTAKFLWIVERRASLLPNRGCVLDVDPDSSAQPFTAQSENPAPWPAGDAALPPAQWGPGVNVAGLQKVVDDAFVGSGDPTAANARGIAVIHDGKLLIQKQGTGFPKSTPLLGWSMTKTVNMMILYKKAQETNFDLNQLVINAFPPNREPSWVADWRKDSRKSLIKVSDLMFMRSGLDMEDDYGPQGKVVQMLYGEPSMAAFAASQRMLDDPGKLWAYSTGSSDILSQIAQGMFPNDQEYWQYWQNAVFGPIGINTGVFATDTSGTWVGGSYIWASTGDWAKLGQLMLNDGAWGSQQVVPKGWWKLAGVPAMPDGDGHGYGAQTWIPGQPVGGECKSDAGVPKDTLSMDGHYGQLVAMVPSKKAVIVRLGWTIDKTKFDGCQFMSDVLANLPDAK